MPNSAMKIMYVEDNPANISLVQRIARMGGHQVVSFSNGEQCLNNFEKENPDLVFMDVQLEGRLTGLDVVRALRGRGMKQPIIAVTAYAMLGDKERCIEAGCDNYISKPLPITELVELVQRYEIEVSGASGGVAARATAEVPNPAARKEETATAPEPEPASATTAAPASTPAAATTASPTPTPEAATTAAPASAPAAVTTAVPASTPEAATTAAPAPTPAAATSTPAATTPTTTTTTT